MKQPFADLEIVRQQAASNIEDGAVTGAYHADRARVVEALGELFATSLICWLRCNQHRFVSRRAPIPEVAACFADAADRFGRFAQAIAERMSELRGTPDFRPESLVAQSHVPFGDGSTPIEAVRESLIGARVQIDTLTAMVRWLGDDDPTTRRTLEDGLRVVEWFADEMRRIYELLGSANEPVRVDGPHEPPRRSADHDRWSEPTDKPPWWDPQWIARG